MLPLVEIGCDLIFIITHLNQLNYKGICHSYMVTCSTPDICKPTTAVPPDPIWRSTIR